MANLKKVWNESGKFALCEASMLGQMKVAGYEFDTCPEVEGETKKAPAKPKAKPKAPAKEAVKEVAKVEVKVANAKVAEKKEEVKAEPDIVL